MACCGARRHVRYLERSKTGQEHWRSHGLLPYNRDTHTCCCGIVKRKRKSVGSRAVWKCCQFRPYNARTHFCCHGRVYKRLRQSTVRACCGGEIFSVNQHECCGGSIHARNDCYRCCAGLFWYNVKYDRCKKGHVDIRDTPLNIHCPSQ
ncbi:uncharacterized protein LOC141903350 [Tubulanus polymorphus]|uniref:uncharacterized protein LOC141903350 n=1 Tax=Tubulanus polymorphus TaxID=672921 RepID=UPI003DA1D925